MEIISKNYLSTLTATGASQTPLEGNALASGCAGCDGDGIYATITKVLFNANWYDGVEGLIIEDNYVEIPAGEYNRQLVVYAYYKNGAPKQVSADKLNFAVNPEGGLQVSPAGAISGTANDTTVVTATAKEVADLVTSATIAIAE